MIYNDPRYAPVEGALPTTLPPLTMANALPAYLRIVRRFGATKDIPVGVLEARAGRPITSNRKRARRVWASTKPTTGHYRGWGRLIHDASHYIFERRHPNARPHDGGHATLEREIAQWVVERGLIGIYSRPPEPKRRPSYAERIDHNRALMAKWERKAKRAATALRKLQARVRMLERLAKHEDAKV